MRYNIFSYLVGEGFKNTLKNKKSTSAALTIMCMSMFMFGIFFLLGQNINYVMEQVEGEQGFKVILELDATDQEVQEIESEIRQIEGTNTIQFISREEGYSQTKQDLKDAGDTLPEGYVEYFPDSFLVTLTDLELNSSVQEKILKIDKVEEIQSSDETITALMNITKGIRWVTLGILIILIFISIFIITNTIKLTVHARRKEISIMKYVGATNSFIRWPFIVEGIIIGLISALITLFIVGAIYNSATKGLVQTDIFKTLNLKLYTFSDLFKLLCITYIALGAGIGIIGSSISMRKYLEV
ncbi:MAG: ABC transporter permease [Clostridia bacterium]|nr:ABC transporter permease [Clostridia bacterium]